MKSPLFLAALMSIVSPAFAQDTSAAAEGSAATAETVTIADDASNRMTVPVMVNGQGPFRFIIDTGADRSVISKELAQKLALPDAPKARLLSMGGVKDVRTVKIDSLRISPKRELRNLVAPALLAENLGADGLLGLDALKGQRILMDFTAQTITIEPGNTREVRNEAVGRDVIVVRGRSRLGQLVLVDADANGEAVWVIVATGGQNSVANSAFRHLMMTKAPSGGFKQVELLSVVGDHIPADYTIVGRMRVGGVVMGNAAVAFADARPFKRFGLDRHPAMLMGMDSLRSFRRVSIDFANKQVRFQLPEAGGSSAMR
jgi:predicted aspartyl protease